MDSPIKILVITNICAVGLFLAKELFSIFRSGQRDNSKAMSENTRAIGSLDKSIARLEVQMEYFRTHVEKIPRLEKDVDAAHAAIREVQGKPLPGRKKINV